jgi:5-deoxy-glucuronate isomerase
MIVKGFPQFPGGYTPICDTDESNSDMLVDFGILKLAAGELYTNEDEKERAFLLINGKVEIELEGISWVIERHSLLDESPSVVHLPAGMKISFRGQEEGAELSVHKVNNPTGFTTKLYGREEIRTRILAAGKLKDTTERILRVVLDDENEPWSNMTMGELINKPGLWSSYPPHHHPHPEIYHYRFIPGEGFGYSEEGDEVFKVKHGDTALISPHKTHCQTAAPGYTMVYIWTMPHLKEERFGTNSRRFIPEYTHLLE